MKMTCSLSEQVTCLNVSEVKTEVNVPSQSLDGMLHLMCGSINTRLQAAGLAESTVQTTDSYMKNAVNGIYNQAQEEVQHLF